VGLFAHISFNPPEKGRALVSAFLCFIWTCSSLFSDNIQGVLHSDEGRRGTLAAGVVTTVLIVNCEVYVYQVVALFSPWQDYLHRKW
jgi:hypothetical protein